jgi:hypothetical protein
MAAIVIVGRTATITTECATIIIADITIECATIIIAECGVVSTDERTTTVTARRAMNIYRYC